MLEHLVAKLSQFVALDEDDRNAIRGLRASVSRFRAHQDIIKEGEVPRCLFAVAEGCAFRYKIVPNGTRQIMSFMFPGDTADLHGVLFTAMDHSISTACPTTIIDIPRERIINLFDTHPRVAAALWCNSMQEKAILRERIATMGSRDAYSRIAHFLCELHERLLAVGETMDFGYVFPLTQIELADALGITVVHANRTLKRLRDNRLIETNGRSLKFFDLDALKKVADFDPSYLHLNAGTPLNLSHRGFAEVEAAARHEFQKS